MLRVLLMLAVAAPLFAVAPRMAQGAGEYAAYRERLAALMGCSFTRRDHAAALTEQCSASIEGQPFTLVIQADGRGGVAFIQIGTGGSDGWRRVSHPLERLLSVFFDEADRDRIRALYVGFMRATTPLLQPYERPGAGGFRLRDMGWRGDAVSFLLQR